MNKSDIEKNIIDAVTALAVAGVSNVDLYIAGSSAMGLRRIDFRSTQDIDLAKSIGLKGRKILKNYNINDAMALSTDPNISDDFEYINEASDLIYEKHDIRVYLAWEEIVLILKGFYKERDKDIQDVRKMTGKLDNARLDKALEIIIKSRERHGQKAIFINEFKEVVEKLKGDK